MHLLNAPPVTADPMARSPKQTDTGYEYRIRVDCFRVARCANSALGQPRPVCHETVAGR
jgi:hypothetical protein